MRIGFIGTGNIASAMIRGLCRAAPAPERVLVSPRNAEKAAILAGEFAQVEVATDNQAVIDGSDWVVLSTRPPVLADVVSSLAFRAGQTVISVAAAIPLAVLMPLVAPVTQVIRAVPQPTVARHIGPVALFPANRDAVALFNRIGTAVPVDDEKQFDALCTITAVAASQYAFLGRVADWLVGQGVERQPAVRFTTAIAQTIAADADKAEEHGFSALIQEISTPGGMNEQVLRMLTDAGWFAPLDEVLDAIMARYRRPS